MTNYQRQQAFVKANMHRVHQDENATTKPRNNGKIWISQDETDLKHRYLLNHPIENIAQALGRSPFAIECRLVKLGLWDENGKPTKVEENDNTAMRELDYIKKYGIKSYYATGSIASPFRMGNMIGKLEGYNYITNGFDNKTIDRLAKAQGVYVVTGKGKILGGSTEHCLKNLKSYKISRRAEEIWPAIDTLDPTGKQNLNTNKKSLLIDSETYAITPNRLGIAGIDYATVEERIIANMTHRPDTIVFDEATKITNAWRKANPKITQTWNEYSKRRTSLVPSKTRAHPPAPPVPGIPEQDLLLLL